MKCSCKVWMSTDDTSGYLCECQIHIGEGDNDESAREDILGTRVVTNLTHCNHGQ